MRLATGDHPVTLDQLDAALEAGQITADTLVCAPGTDGFVRLGAIAGLDDDAPPSVDVGFDAWPAPPLPVVAPFAAPRRTLMSVDLGVGASFRPRFAMRTLLLVPAALAVLGIIVFAASASASSEAAASLPVESARAALAPATSPADPAPTPNAAPAAAAAPSPALTEAQKRALAARDRKAEVAGKAKRAAASPKRAFAAGKSAPFSKSGDRHDPLNGAI